MEYDSLGLIFIGLSLMFLIAVLFGHQRREHMSNQKSKWNSIQKSVEDSLKEKYDFDIAKFRKSTSDQVAFFKNYDKLLQQLGSLTGITLVMPDVKDMKDTEKPFDERFRLIDEDIKNLLEFAKKRSKDDKEQSKFPFDAYVDMLSKNAKMTLTSVAKRYMIEKSTPVFPKSGLSTISKILG